METISGRLCRLVIFRTKNADLYLVRLNLPEIPIFNLAFSQSLLIECTQKIALETAEYPTRRATPYRWTVTVQWIIQETVVSSRSTNAVKIPSISCRDFLRDAKAERVQYVFAAYHQQTEIINKGRLVTGAISSKTRFSIVQYKS